MRERIGNKNNEILKSKKFNYTNNTNNTYKK